jgi:hypothetical protein
MGERLLLAYTTLMDKAPGAAFRRARELYLNKYCVPQGNADHPLRLFVCDEQTDESVVPAPDGEPGHRLVTLTSRPGQLAIVHWQQTCPPTPLLLESYLAEEWELHADDLDLSAWTSAWFREGGHQTRFTPPVDLIVQQQSLLTLKE